MQAMIKYGVVSMASIHQDLHTWNRLYLAGRLHKPVQTLLHHPTVQQAQQCNKEFAMRTALLLLPEQSRMVDVLRTICMLSYAGDFRMGIAEDPKKVDRIVSGSSQGLMEMYSSVLERKKKEGLVDIHTQEAKDASHSGSNVLIYRNSTRESIATLLGGLPIHVLQKIAKYAGIADFQSRAGMHQQIGHDIVQKAPGYSELVRRAVSSIVRSSSHRQAMVGLLSAGVVKSIRYAWAKLRKA